jgi:hypothetical protein
LAKYGSWEEVPQEHCLINLLDSAKAQDRATQFGNLKKKGVGQTTILKFLGSNFHVLHKMFHSKIATKNHNRQPIMATDAFFT